MSEGIKTNESEGVSATSSSTTVVAVGPGSNSAPSAPSSVAEAMQSPLGQSQIPTQVRKITFFLVIYAARIYTTPTEPLKKMLLYAPLVFKGYWMPLFYRRWNIHYLYMRT